MTKDQEIDKAFKAWDNHLQDCKATRLDHPKGAPEGIPPVQVEHRCTYSGDKCPRGMERYLAWRKAIGSPVFAQPQAAEEGGR